jgi:hypothetical protein
MELVTTPETSRVHHPEGLLMYHIGDKDEKGIKGL